jgi:anti-anti-sigma regulatory factor
MDAQQLEPDVLLVFLRPEPQLHAELTQLRQVVAQARSDHLILDFSRVEIITSASIGSLLLLKQTLSQQERRLILCNARLATRCILRVVGLDGFFGHVSNKSDALKALHRSRQPEVEALRGDR